MNKNCNSLCMVGVGKKCWQIIDFKLNHNRQKTYLKLSDRIKSLFWLFWSSKFVRQQVKNLVTMKRRSLVSTLTPSLFIGLLLCICAGGTHAEVNEVVVWHKNARIAATFEFIELALEKSEYAFQLKVKNIEDNEQAFTALANANLQQRLDVIVAGVSTKRESEYLPVYIPLDRGLLGFRLCLIAPGQQANLKRINEPQDFDRLGLSMSLVRGWPDVSVMQQNHIPVLESQNHEQAVEVLKQNKASCFSRSVIEIDAELSRLPGLIEEQHLALIYPFADIIYVNPNNPELHRALSSGMQKAIDDRSFFELHDTHYHRVLMRHRFYVRKLLIMENNNLSQEAHDAINRYGIASFNRLHKSR